MNAPSAPMPDPTIPSWTRLPALFLCVSTLTWSAPRSLQASDSSSPQPQTEVGLEFFEQRIRPVLATHCYSCHAATAKIVRGGLLLDSRDAMRKGGDSGPAVVPGRPEESLILQALKHETVEMPPDQMLPDPVITDFETWIRQGAPDPRTQAAPVARPPVDWDKAKQHWAFQPLSDPVPPDSGESSWVRNGIDAFVLQQLTAQGLKPADAASRRTLIRRATFDLIGLPPTVDEINDFLADESPDSFQKVVERLLASPHYGERWGRHWLDLVRYADTNGADENHALPNAWKYRDWVVRMINQDLPLDEFIVRQLAGDLLPVPADEREAGDLLTATGMLVIGPKMLAEQDKDKMIIDMVDEQIDTVGRTMLGLTIGCARCHDHKFDPLSSRDYYALAGIFYSTQTMADRAFVSKWMERPLPSKDLEARRAAHQQKIDAARDELKRLESGGGAEDQIKQKKAELEQLEKDLPPLDMVMAAQDAEAADLPVHLRGNHLTPGPEKIRRGMPAVLTAVAAAPVIDANSSGRLELARWLVSRQNPLTARVMVNRIWMWHFGQPLMRSPSNWGLQADPPADPQLLDWLAQELIRRQWSLRDMHRLIMLSATWQMSSQSRPEAEQTDPENRLWWRQNRRRLEAELIRDAVLAVGGGLDRSLGNVAENTDAPRRSIYLPINRSALYEMFSTFDYVETANHIEQRPVTTVPQQALFLLNSPMVHEQARRLASQVLSHSSADEGDVPLIAELFQRLYGRLPEDAEARRSSLFLSEADQLLGHVTDPQERRLQAWAGLCRTLMAGNEFVYVD